MPAKYIDLMRNTWIVSIIPLSRSRSLSRGKLLRKLSINLRKPSIDIHPYEALSSRDNHCLFITKMESLRAISLGSMFLFLQGAQESITAVLSQLNRTFWDRIPNKIDVSQPIQGYNSWRTRTKASNQTKYSAQSAFYSTAKTPWKKANLPISWFKWAS